MLREGLAEVVATTPAASGSLGCHWLSAGKQQAKQLLVIAKKKKKGLVLKGVNQLCVVNNQWSFPDLCE